MIEHLEDNSDPRKETLGNLFQRTRRSQHKTLEEAAAATRIHQSSLAALEADDFDHLPAEVFTRGFIKLYAKYLGLDPDETLGHYISQENADPDKPADRPYRRDILDGEAMAHAPTFFKGNRRTLTVILLLAVLVGFYTLGKFYKPIAQQVGEAIPENEIVRSLTEEQGPPPAETMPPAEEPAAAATPVENGLKVPEPAGQPESSTTGSEQEASAQLKSPPRSAPEALRKAKPESAPPKSQPPPTVKPVAVASLAAAATPAAHAPEPAPAKPTASPTGLPAESGSPNSRPLLPVTVKVATTAVDGAKSELTAAATTPPAPENYVLEANFRERSWVHVEVDDEPVREYTSQASVTRIWRASRRLVLKLDNVEAVGLTLNGKPLSLGGEPGEVVTIRLPPDSP